MPQHGRKSARYGPLVEAGEHEPVEQFVEPHRVPAAIRELNERLIGERVALEGSLFFGAQTVYRHRERSALLDFQRDALAARPAWLRRASRALERGFDARLRADLRAKLGA